MPKRATFSVSKKGHDPIEVSRDLPENLNDEVWHEIVSNPDEDIHDLAIQAWIVKCQAGARGRLESGPDAVQQYVSAYKFGARSGGFAAPTISMAEAKGAKFSAAQIEFLRKAGMKVETEEAAA